MPTYEYLCHACGHRLEIVQRMSDDPLTDCPECKASALVKQIQPVGFQLKGTGWYVTDFRDKGNARKVGSSADEGSKGESKSEGGSDDSAKKAATAGGD